MSDDDESMDTGFVPKERYNKLLASCRKLLQEKKVHLRELANQEETINKRNAQVASMEHKLKVRKTARGRSQLKRDDLNGFQIVNNVILGTVLRYTWFIYFPFLHESWSKWLPNDPDSFYLRIIEDLDVPEEASDELVWGDEIVPLINKKYIEIRSNFSTHVKEAILSKYIFHCHFP